MTLGRRNLLLALRTTALAAAVLLLGADLASACHKKKARGCKPAPVAHSCYATPVAYGGPGVYSTGQGVAYGGYGAEYGGAPPMGGYSSYPVTDYGYGNAGGMVGQTMGGVGRAVGGVMNQVGGVGQGLMGGYGTPGTFGGPYGPGYGAGGYGVGFGGGPAYGPGGYGGGMGGLGAVPPMY